MTTRSQTVKKKVSIEFGRGRKMAKLDYWLRHVRPSAWNNSALIGRVFIKFDIRIFRKSVEKMQVSLKYDKNSGYFK